MVSLEEVLVRPTFLYLASRETELLKEFDACTRQVHSIKRTPPSGWLWHTSLLVTGGGGPIQAGHKGGGRGRFQGTKDKQVAGQGQTKLFKEEEMQPV